MPKAINISLRHWMSVMQLLPDIDDLLSCKDYRLGRFQPDILSCIRIRRLFWTDEPPRAC